MSVGTTYIVDFIATDPIAPNEKTLQMMLALVGLFTTVLFVCTLKMNMTISLLFALLATTCYLLAGGVRNKTVDKIGGGFGLATAFVAYWLASAELINVSRSDAVISVCG
jgi:succinate-acetate transporter protein